MSQENLDVAWRFGQAFNEHDVEVLCELTRADVEFAPYPPTALETTTYAGHEGLRRYFADADAAWETLQVRLDDARDLGSKIVSWGNLSGRGRLSGVEIDTPFASVIELREGKIVSVHTFTSREKALKAVGLEE